MPKGVEITHTKFGAHIRSFDGTGFVGYETPEALSHGLFAPVDRKRPVKPWQVWYKF